MQLVATPDTVTFDFDPPGTHYSISVSHMSAELVQFMSVVESYVHTYISMLRLLKINTVDSEDVFFFC